MASSSRGNNQKRQRQWQSSCWWLLPLLASIHSWVGVEALPITSRPIEGNAQGEAWKAWLRLSDEQRTLEKPKKVMPKSIFALPYRHCPPGHKLYNERCIPQININPTDIVAQELQGQLGQNGGSQFGFTDYDYSDSESDELIYEFPLGPLIQNEPITTLTSPSGAEDQALPSEDAPLKFNIFEKKFPTAPDDFFQPDAVNATTPATAIATATVVSATAIATTTPTPTPTLATFREDALKTNNRITSDAQDLLADASNTWPSTTTLSIPSSSTSSSSNIAALSDIGNIDAIVVPAGVSLNGKESMVQLVTSSMSDETNANADTNSRPDTHTTDTDTDTESESEADLEELLKADAFQLADVNMMPLFSHRRISPLLSADLDDGDDVTATDIVPTGEENDDATTATTATATATAATETTPTTAILSSTQAQVPGEEEQEIDESDLKKSKVQPVQLVTTAAATTATTAATTPPTIASISTTTTTAAETEVAAIHQEANGNKRDDDDRFYYQPFVRNVAASGSSSSSTRSTSPNAADSDLDGLNDMASSENLMTNTIGGQSDSERTASEINFEQELRIINELVKGKRRLSQLRQQQQQHEQSTSSSSSSSTTIPKTTTAIIESSSNAFSTTATATASDATSTATTAATTATETTTFWSKLMPTLSQSSTAEETTTVSTASEQTTETITTTTAATLKAANVADSSIAKPTTTTKAAAAAATQQQPAIVRPTQQHLSINTNRSNMNSKRIRIDSRREYPQPITKTISPRTTTTTTTTTTTPSTMLDTLPNDESYTPFWWLPSIGWRLDRQVDEKGEDRSLLLRLFRTFRANDSDTTAPTTTTTTATTATATNRGSCCCV